MEIFTILLFSAALIGCVAAQISVLYALVAGYLIFCAYVLFKKHTADAQIASMLNGGGVRSMLNASPPSCACPRPTQASLPAPACWTL